MILNVQQIWTRYLPDTIRERKREKKKQIKFIIQIILLSIDNEQQDPGTFSKSAIHTMYYFKACEIWYRRCSSCNRCGTGSRSIPQSLVDDRHPRFGERAVASRFMARFTPVLCLTIGLLSSHRPSALPLLLSCRSDRPRRLFSP